MKLKRLLASILSVSMLVSMMPVQAFGANETTGSVTEEVGGKLYTSKNAVLQEDGTYTINLEAFSTGEYSEVVEEIAIPLDIVLVMDQSGSMTNEKKNLAAVKNNVNSFIDRVYKDGKDRKINHRIAMVGFASGAYESLPGGTSSTEYLGTNKDGWVNTGVFLKDGTFKNYMSTAGYPGYTLVEPPYVRGNSYYVKDGREVYVSADFCDKKYVQITSPDTARNDIYGYIGGKYVPVHYVQEKIEYKSVPQTGLDFENNEYFQDPHGTTKISSIPQNPDGTKADRGFIRDTDKIDSGRLGFFEYTGEYYIKQTDGKWRKIKPTFFEPGTYWKWVDKPSGAPSGLIRYGKVTVNGIEDFADWNYDTNGIVYPKYRLVKKGEKVVYPNRSDIAIPQNENVYLKTGGGGAWIDSAGNVARNLYVDNQLFNKLTYMEDGVLTDVGNKDVYVKTTGITNEEYKGALRNVANPDGTINGTLIKNKNDLKGLGGTRTGVGLTMANDIFANNPIPENEHRQRIVVMFTDGLPAYLLKSDTGEERLAVNEAHRLKNTYGAKVYTVGIGSDFANANNEMTKEGEFLNHISSNYPDAVYDLTGPVMVSNPPDKTKKYAINIGGRYAGIEYNVKDKRWKADIKGQTVNITPVSPKTIPNYKNKEYHVYELVKKPGTPVASDQKIYSTVAKDFASVNTNMFDTIYQTNTIIKHPFYADGTSIFRDIVTEDFRITNNTKVVVNYIPGKVPDDFTGNEVIPENITWGSPVPQLTLDLASGKTKAEGTDGVTVQIAVHEHGTHDKNKYQNMDIIDVSGFDYGKYYVGKNHPGFKITVAITGIQPQPTVNPDGATVNTNHPDSGVWVPGSDKPEVPMEDNPDVKKDIVEKTYIQDYAKPVDIGLSSVGLSDAYNVRVAQDGINKEEIVAETQPDNIAKDDFGELQLNSKPIDEELIDGKRVDKIRKWMTYTPKNMNWNGADTFFIFGLGKEKPARDPDEGVTYPEKNTNAPRLAMVNVIPANNVYYEDSFITNESTGTVGIVYNTSGTGTWTTEGSSKPGTINPESDTNDSHGWIPALDGQLADSDGTVHHATVKYERGSMATATFTFTGTGVDIYSRTSPDTGTITAKLRSSDGKIKISQFIDTVSTSGTYYQVPTLSFDKQKDGSPLPYGEYTVSILVTAGAHLENRFDYYLDGIRVYNPMQNAGTITDKGYGESEKNAVFTDVRDNLIDVNKYAENGSSMGVFIDQIKKDGQEFVGHDGPITPAEFKDYGPKNEVYLGPGQQISFSVDTTKNSKYQIGLKALDGKPLDVKLSNDQNAVSTKINHSGDMYYSISPDAKGVVHIINATKKGTGKGSILAVTKLKVTNAVSPVSEAGIFTEKENQQIMQQAATFRSMAFAPPVKPDSGDSDNTKPEKPDVIKPEKPDVIQPDVEIDNPKPNPVVENIMKILDKIFDGFRGWFL